MKPTVKPKGGTNPFAKANPFGAAKAPKNIRGMKMANKRPGGMKAGGKVAKKGC